MDTIGDWLKDAESAFLDIDGLNFSYHDEKLYYVGEK